MAHCGWANDEARRNSRRRARVHVLQSLVVGVLYALIGVVGFFGDLGPLISTYLTLCGALLVVELHRRSAGTAVLELERLREFFNHRLDRIRHQPFDVSKMSGSMAAVWRKERDAHHRAKAVHDRNVSQSQSDDQPVTSPRESDA